MFEITERSAVFSECRRYRYALWRRWPGLFGGKGYAMFIGLNPSTADECNEDPTVIRCIKYAQAWGYDALCMTNLFGFRATDPACMLAEAEPIGPDNDRTLATLAQSAAIIVAAWGVHGAHLGRGAAVTSKLPTMHCLRLTKAGHPGHPLYLRADLLPSPWNPTI